MTGCGFRMLRVLGCARPQSGEMRMGGGAGPGVVRSLSGCLYGGGHLTVAGGIRICRCLTPPPHDDAQSLRYVAGAAVAAGDSSEGVPAISCHMRRLWIFGRLLEGAQHLNPQRRSRWRSAAAATWQWRRLHWRRRPPETAALWRCGCSALWTWSWPPPTTCAMQVRPHRAHSLPCQSSTCARNPILPVFVVHDGLQVSQLHANALLLGCAFGRDTSRAGCVSCYCSVGSPEACLPITSLARSWGGRPEGGEARDRRSSADNGRAVWHTGR